MRFKAVTIKNAHMGGHSDLPLVLFALRRMKPKLGQGDIVVRLAPNSLALACPVNATEELHTQSTFKIDRLFSSFLVESKRSNLIDIRARASDIWDLFQLCARSDTLEMRLAVSEEQDPIIAFQFAPYDVRCATKCTGHLVVSVLTELEADAIRAPSLLESTGPCTSETSKRMLALHNDRLFTDSCVVVRDVSIPVHRAVVAAVSPVMRRMLESEMKEGRTANICLQDTSLEAASALVDFMYGLPVRELSPGNLGELFKLGHFYDIGSLMDICVDRMSLVEDLDESAALLRLLARFRQEPGIADAIQCLGELLWQRASCDRAGFFHLIGLEECSNENWGGSSPCAKRRRVDFQDVD